jgi:hypothetical protein
LIQINTSSPITALPSTPPPSLFVPFARPPTSANPGMCYRLKIRILLLGVHFEDVRLYYLLLFRSCIAIITSLMLLLSLHRHPHLLLWLPPLPTTPMVNLSNFRSVHRLRHPRHFHYSLSPCSYIHIMKARASFTGSCVSFH